MRLAALLLLLAGSPARAALSFVATIKDANTHQPASQITWSSVVPGSTQWKVANQYIQLDAVMTDPNNGYIRTFTDNTAPTANPVYTGLNDAVNNAGGLIPMSNPTTKIPLAWSNLAANTGAFPAGDPNGTFSWFYYLDRTQQTFSTAASIDYETVLAPGLYRHYQPGPMWGSPVSWQAYTPATSPTYMYFEADFTNALGGTTYQTTTLTIEAFTL